MLKKHGKKILVYLLALAMLLTFAPLTVLAGSDAEETAPVVQSEETGITDTAGSEAAGGITETGEEAAAAEENAEVPAEDAAEAVTEHSASAENEAALSGTEPEFTVTYNANGGYFWDDPETTTYTKKYYEGGYFQNYTPDNDDDSLMFDGWYDEQGHLIDWDTIVDRDMTVTAHWTESVIVTYDANGGYFWDDPETTTVTSKFKKGGYFQDYTTQIDDDSLAFDGWYDEQGNRLDWNTIVDRDMTVTAHWTEAVYITYDANGGYFWDDPEMTKFTEKIKKGNSFPYYYTPEIDDDSLAFDGWYDAKEGGNKIEYSYTVTESMTVYAHWTESVIITFDANGGHFMDGKTKIDRKVAKGSYFEYYDTPASDDSSKVFIGWKDKDGNIISYQQVMENMTVYADWADAVTITFDPNGGSIPMYGKRPFEAKFTKGSYYSGEYNFSEAVGPNGEAFAGWATTSNATEPNIGRYMVPFDSNMTVYAVWGERCTVTFDANGGLIDNTSQVKMSFVKGKTFVFPYARWEGADPRNFDGWYDKKEGGTRYNNSYDITGDMTLYAHWKEYKTITYDANGGYFELYGPEQSGRSETYVSSFDPDAYFREPYSAPNPPAGGKVLLGWATTKDARVPNVTSSTQFKNLSTVYAVWDTGVKVTIHANGGYFIDENNKKTETQEVYVKSGSNVGSMRLLRYPNNDSSGKRFMQQFSKTPNGSAYTGSITEPMDLYVMWSDVIVIRLDCGNGSIWGDKTYQISASQGFTISLNSYSPESNDPSKAFYGWSTTGEAKDIVTSITATSPMTLYAVYSSGNKVTFYYDSNKAYVSMSSGGMMNSSSIIWPNGVNYKDMRTRFSANGTNGNLVLGFSTSPDGKNLINDSYSPSGATTLYVITVPGTNVTFSANGGSFPSLDNQQPSMTIGVRRGQAIGLVETPVFPGNRFVGWRTQQGEMINPMTYIPSGDSMYLLAVWEPSAAPDPSRLKTGWNKVDGLWYYVTKSKEIKKGWMQDGNNWYYLDPVNGAMHTGWVYDKGSTYYMNSSGVMATGWVKIGNIWYYMNSSGVMQTGWLKVGTAWYYMAASGAMVTGWLELDGTWYYMNTSGVMATGWVKSGKAWYYMNSSGVMQTGWVRSGNTWYYMNASGAMQTGWVKIGKTWYYMNSSGAMQTGWVKSGNAWYYMNSSGAMQTGWVKSGSTWYYMHNNGVMASNEWVPGYYWIGSSGAWTYQPKGSWHEDKVGRWFGDTSGWYAKNEKVKIDGVLYRFNASGYEIAK